MNTIVQIIWFAGLIAAVGTALFLIFYAFDGFLKGWAKGKVDNLYTPMLAGSVGLLILLYFLMTYYHLMGWGMQ